MRTHFTYAGTKKKSARVLSNVRNLDSSKSWWILTCCHPTSEKNDYLPIIPAKLLTIWAYVQSRKLDVHKMEWREVQLYNCNLSQDEPSNLPVNRAWWEYAWIEERDQITVLYQRRMTPGNLLYHTHNLGSCSYPKRIKKCTRWNDEKSNWITAMHIKISLHICWYKRVCWEYATIKERDI